MSSPALRIPAFIGGIPTKADFAPSILFAVLYGLLLIPVLYRFFRRSSRTYTLLIFGALPFVIERIVVFSIRASQSHTPTSADWLDSVSGAKGKLVYQQISFSLGFFSVATDCVPLLRCLLVNTTLEDEERGSKDLPRRRFWYRRFSDVYGLIYLAASIPGIIAGGRYSKSTRDQDAGDKVFVLRYASSALVLILLYVFIAIIRTARRRIQYMDGKAIDFMTALIVITSIVPLYRLGVMHNRTSSVNPLPPTFTTYPPGNLTSGRDKALFYIFHALPEYIANALLVSVNIRKLLNTGPFGDWRGSDKSGIPILRKDGLLFDEGGREFQSSRKMREHRSGGDEGGATEEGNGQGPARNEETGGSSVPVDDGFARSLQPHKR